MGLEQLFPQPIYMKTFCKRFLGDIDTPVSSYFKLANEPDSFMLESMQGTGYHARYSVIGMKPFICFQRFPEYSLITQVTTGKELILTEGNPFEHLKHLLKCFIFERPALFQTGFLCGYIGYDAIRYIEKISVNSDSDFVVPEMYLILPTEVVIFDNFTHTLHFIVHLEDTPEGATRLDDAEEKLTALVSRFSRPKSGIKEFRPEKGDSLLPVEANFNFRDYLQCVRQAKEYIRNGDIFQVVLSRRFQTEITASSFDIYRILRLINPSPYMFYLHCGEFQLTGSSPETMVKYDGQRVIVRPIAGTRKRGVSPEDDRRIAAELLNDKKELAEHEMLVDLGRNDVGRIARYGTVRLDTYKQIENYSHVMHIVSTVSGELDQKCDIVDIFKACFPAGTVSGAPKVRAMQIIDELEKSSRGPYAGAVGYFDYAGRMDTCIAIRTLLVKNQMAYWQAGGGIVADSVPENEFEETENKARALLKAITLAEEVNHDCND